MNVLFTDGLTINRRLRYIDEISDAQDHYDGRYDEHSEAFQFYKSIDNIWGPFKTRDLEELKYSSGLKISLKEKEYDSKTDKEKENLKDDYKVKFKQKYYLKRVIDIDQIKNFHQDDWDKLEEVDLVKLFPEGEIFNSEYEDILGVAFDIYVRERFEKPDDILNREKAITYFLEISLICVNDIDKNMFQKTFHSGTNEIKIRLLKDLLKFTNRPQRDLSRLPFDNESIYHLSPTLVLNKKTIRENRNYTGEGWDSFPDNWDRMPECKFHNIENAIDYWEIDPIKIPKKMIVRIGREGSHYKLFLHGDKEGNTPIELP
jgi:hypothetical protein